MKIAIIGTAASYKEAPVNDPTWRLWTISGCANDVKNLERLYELHDPETIQKEHEKKEGYVDLANSLGERFIIRGPNPNYPKARILPWQHYVEKHGKSPFSSSIAWILAEAIAEFEKCTDEEKVIGIWGVHMAAKEEYGHQKAGCRELIGWAKGMGIKVGTPSTSELMLNPYLYGVEDMPRSMIINAHQKENMTQHRKNYEAAAEDKTNEGFHYALMAVEGLEIDGKKKEEITTKIRGYIRDARVYKDMSLKHLGAEEYTDYITQNFFSGGS